MKRCKFRTATIILLVLLVVVGMLTIKNKWLYNSDMSPVARSLLNINSKEWAYVTSCDLKVYAQNKRTMDIALRKALFAKYELQKLFRCELSQKIIIFVVPQEELWTSIKKKAGWMQDGAAISFGSEIFVTTSAASDESPGTAIFHELIHCWIQECYQDKIPFVIEEGLAVNLGLRLTKGFYKQHGSKIVVTKTAELSENTNYTFEELFTLKTYPANATDHKAFQKQAENLVKKLYEILGEKKLMEIIDQAYVTNESFMLTLQNSGISETEQLALQQSIILRDI